MESKNLENVKANKKNQYLPEDAIEDILVRLPVKTLSQFKCVCKSWCSLIKNPNFIIKHFHHENNHASFLIQRNDPKAKSYMTTLFLDHEELLTFEEPDHLQLPNCLEKLAGPLNGIFCILNLDLQRIALWNPAIREFRQLPIANANLPSYMKMDWYDLALGFDLISNEYKVVWVQKFADEVTSKCYHPMIIAVYCSSTDSWRCFEDVALLNSGMQILESTTNNYFNGVYYWMTNDIEKNNSILTFDMGIEVLSKIELPDCLRTHDMVLLALCNESVALISYEQDVEKSIDVWLMKEEGYWTKDWTIDPIWNEHFFVGFWKNNGVFIDFMSLKVFIYDADSYEIQNFEVLDDQYDFSVCTYKESLASVKRGNEYQEMNDPSVVFQEFFEENHPRIEEEHEDRSIVIFSNN